LQECSGTKHRVLKLSQYSAPGEFLRSEG
jgi:hypothetical protein